MYQYEPANQTVDEVYSPLRLKPIRQTINGFTYSVLPPTEYVFYMIHHMLKHYLYSGFGIRLLCDFVLYLKRYEKEIDFPGFISGARLPGSAISMRSFLRPAVFTLIFPHPSIRR